MSSLRMIASSARAIRYSAPQPVLSRGAHGTHPVNTILPFSYGNKRTLALKLIAYFGGAFATPFALVWYQWNKPGGLHNP